MSKHCILKQIVWIFFLIKDLFGRPMTEFDFVAKKCGHMFHGRDRMRIQTTVTEHPPQCLNRVPTPAPGQRSSFRQLESTQCEAMNFSD